MRGVYGAVSSRPFVDFSTTRNLALALAEEYEPENTYGRLVPFWLLMLSGDMVVERPELLRGIVEEAEAAGCVAVRVKLRTGGYVHTHVDLVKARAGCHYKGVVHEAMNVPPGGKVYDASDSGLLLRYTPNDARDNDRWVRDRALLERERDAPGADVPPRSVFYLAQTYECLGLVNLAIKAYALRIAMVTGFDDERFIAQLRIARMMHVRLDPYADTIRAYQVAIDMRPNRAEPHYWLSRLYTEMAARRPAYGEARQAAALPMPSGQALFVNADVYEWRAKDCLAAAAYHVGRFEDCIRVSRDLLAGGFLPNSERPRVDKNIALSQEALCVASDAHQREAAP